MNNAERNIKSWERLKATGQKKYIFFGGLWWGIFVWITTGFFKKSNSNTFTEIFFSKVGGLQFLIYILEVFYVIHPYGIFINILIKKQFPNKEKHKTINTKFPYLNTD